MKETWKDVNGFDGRYQVSSMGRVRSVDFLTHNNRGSFIRKGKILASGTDNNGYQTATLCVQDKTHRVRIHRLVAQAFIPNPDGKPEVNHIDGNKENNVVTNLEWNTYSENLIHAMEKGLNKQKRPIEQINTETGDVIKVWSCGYEATRALGGASPTAITNALAGRSKTAYGYKWKYHKED